jgi:copper transport outer membrane protein MctB
MFDFRYHALSLVAVFLALGIGIVLGVTIGDSLVSQTEQNLRGSLRNDVVQARDRADDEAANVKARDRALDAALPLIARGRLRRRDIAFVAIGSLPDDVQAAARQAVGSAGGTLSSVSYLDVPAQLPELGRAAGRRFATLNSDESLARRFGLRLGRSLLTGRGIATRLPRVLPDRFKGDFRGADGVIVWRSPKLSAKPGGAPGDAIQAKAEAALEDGLLAALRTGGRAAVGVENSDTDPSQISFFKSHGVASVDSLDLSAGRIALVLALASRATDSYGLKKTAKAPLPAPSK